MNFSFTVSCNSLVLANLACLRLTERLSLLLLRMLMMQSRTAQIPLVSKSMVKLKNGLLLLATL